MTKEQIEEVKAEMERLRKRIAEFEKRKKDEPYHWSCAEAGSVRRASLDLTRALAKMRKP